MSIKQSILFSALIILSYNLQAAEKHQYTIGFFNPHVDNNQTFWGLMEDNIQAACDDLGIKLKIYHSNYLGQVRQLAQAAENGEIDAAIFKPLNHNGLKLLDITEQYKIPSIIINVGLSARNEIKAGSTPRTRYQSWIGQLLPDDEQVGYRLADTLVQVAKQKKQVGPDGKIHMVAISGIKGDGSAIARKKGLERFFAQTKNKDIILHQVVHADWMRANAKRKFLGLKKRYPYTSVIWSANDAMALGVIEGINELGFIPAEDMIVASIDWIPEVLEPIEKGQLSFSLGGHFMDGAWAAILLYDYLHGVDFAGTEGVNLRSKYTLLNTENIKYYRSFLNYNDWGNIDFRHFSKKLNSQLKKYPFTMQAVFEQLALKKQPLNVQP